MGCISGYETIICGQKSKQLTALLNVASNANSMHTGHGCPGLCRGPRKFGPDGRISVSENKEYLNKNENKKED